MAYTTINKSTEHFNTKLYTGTGSNQSLTGVGFQPDLIWWKCRNSGKNHGWSDSVRGNTKRIQSNASSVETTGTDYIQSFNSDGTTIGSNGNINSNGDTFCLWNWKANGQGSSNTAGSINTTYTSVNTTAGFSISTYTGNGYAGATVGHGLGAVPKMIIVKRLNSVDNWRVYHASLGATKYLDLNGTGATNTSSTRWNDTEPTSSVFTIGNNTSVNASASTYVAYCFAEKQGYSKFGSYLGNGNAEGTFVYTGFKPAFVICKQSSSSGDWELYDNKRNGFNNGNVRVYPNASDAEGGTGRLSLLSNGFKITTSSGNLNGSGNSFIYMAFAEAPLVGTNNIPCTAR